ncbi:hypothetical protein [Duganella radicis]|uniref:Uncharacterized protein n=1 Tax=Duganella radicis TaxID=551988 RepID=A0A6L6PQG3_9BURK|nr:hypothetical protein [Duganella radicis]MTV41356.1 hypothetical protein [Duganella radicis]
MGFVAKRHVEIPISDFMDLEFHLMETRPGVNAEDFLAELLHRWLAIEMERASLQKNGRAMRGFQWKNLFLPDGTNLRTCYRHTIAYAKVVGDRIIADDGEALTPSVFANRHGAGRNAWRFVWLRFPGNDYWVRADECRAQKNPDRTAQHVRGRDYEDLSL